MLEILSFKYVSSSLNSSAFSLNGERMIEECSGKLQLSYEEARERVERYFAELQYFLSVEYEANIIISYIEKIRFDIIPFSAFSVIPLRESISFLQSIEILTKDSITVYLKNVGISEVKKDLSDGANAEEDIEPDDSGTELQPAGILSLFRECGWALPREIGRKLDALPGLLIAQLQFSRTFFYHPLARLFLP